MGLPQRSRIIRSIDPDFATYQQRVLAGGGVIIDPAFTLKSILTHKWWGTWSYIQSAVSAAFGVVKDSSGYVSKAFCLKSSSGDAIQTTGAAQPQLAFDSNGKPVFSFAGAQNLSVPGAVAAFSAASAGYIGARVTLSPDVTSRLIIRVWDNAASYRLRLFHYGTNGKIYVTGKRLDAESPIDASLTTYAGAATHYAGSVNWETAALRLLRNNVADGSGTLTSTGLTSATNSSQITIGSSWIGTIADPIILRGLVSDAQRTALYALSSGYWGVE